MTITFNKTQTQEIAVTPEIDLQKAAQIRANVIRFADESSVITQGPIAQQLTDELQRLYAKDKDPETGIILESQVIDETIKDNFVRAIFGSEEVKDQRQGVLYGVKQSSVTPAQVLDLSESLADLSPTQKDNSAVILHGPDGLYSVDSVESSALTMEAYSEHYPMAAAAARVCKRHGVRVFATVESYSADRIKRSRAK